METRPLLINPVPDIASVKCEKVKVECLGTYVGQDSKGAIYAWKFFTDPACSVGGLKPNDIYLACERLTTFYGQPIQRTTYTLLGADKPLIVAGTAYAQQVSS